mmetsp:Transcript_2761/g.4853  ORF Transcript_2761/g.4853 Transcript_2761/m.4853 type:complete len:220 (-) Transcript_2761:499-1158(-)
MVVFDTSWTITTTTTNTIISRNKLDMFHILHIQQSQLQPLLHPIRPPVLDLHLPNRIHIHHPHHSPHGNNGLRDSIHLGLYRFHRQSIRCALPILIGIGIHLQHLPQRIAELFPQYALYSHLHRDRGRRATPAGSLEKQVHVPGILLHALHRDVAPVGNEVRAHLVQHLVDVVHGEFQGFLAEVRDGRVGGGFEGGDDVLVLLGLLGGDFFRCGFRCER